MPTFNPSASTSIQQPQSQAGGQQEVQIHYGSGQVAGVLGQDTVNMGGFTVNPQTFLVVTDMSQGLLDGDTSGIMGLAFQSLASTRAVPFWDALTNAGQFAQPEFSFWLTRFINTQNPSDNEPGGVFTLGGTNSTLFTGDIEFLNLAGTSDASQATFWLLEMTSKRSYALKHEFAPNCLPYLLRPDREWPVGDHIYGKRSTICHRYRHNSYWWTI